MFAAGEFRGVDRLGFTGSRVEIGAESGVILCFGVYRVTIIAIDRNFCD